MASSSAWRVAWVIFRYQRSGCNLCRDTQKYVSEFVCAVTGSRNCLTTPHEDAELEA